MYVHRRDMYVHQAYRRTDSGAMEVGCVQSCALQRCTRRMPTAGNLTKVVILAMAGEPVHYGTAPERTERYAMMGGLVHYGPAPECTDR